MQKTSGDRQNEHILVCLSSSPSNERIVRTAALYLAENRLDDAPVRFDVVEVLPGELRHLRAAFDATGVSEI